MAAVAIAEACVAAQRERKASLRDEITGVSKRLKKLPPALQKVLSDQLRSVLSWDELTESLVRKSGGRVVRPSFRGSLSYQSLGRQDGFSDDPRRLLNGKLSCLPFVDEMGLIRPKLLARDFELDGLPRLSGVVLKPVSGAGSKGVFLAPRTDEIFQNSERTVLRSWDEVIATGKKLLASKEVRSDRWMLEELVLPTPGELVSGRDLKFYAFYGRVELVLEVQRYPKTSYAWWTRAGAKCDTGKYPNELMEGTGFQVGEVEFVERLSQAIPVPFMRIDLLRAQSGFVFGEFTPRPGSYDGFNDETDERLGLAYVEAERRLLRDLLNGKRFSDFFRSPPPLSGEGSARSHTRRNFARTGSSDS